MFEIIIQFLIGVLTPIIFIGGIIAVLNELIQSFEKKEEKQKRRSEQPTKEERFQAIMERLIHDIELKERKEGRYRRLDEAIRRHQQSRKMVAATQENRKKKK